MHGVRVVEKFRLISYHGQTGTVVVCCVRKNSSLTTALKYIIDIDCCLATKLPRKVVLS